MVLSAGKSRKNVDAFVLLPPEVKAAIDLLIHHRAMVGIPITNRYIFARFTDDSPLSGTSDFVDIVYTCPGLKYPERIKATELRRYIATISQVINNSVCLHVRCYNSITQQETQCVKKPLPAINSKLSGFHKHFLYCLAHIVKYELK